VGRADPCLPVFESQILGYKRRGVRLIESEHTRRQLRYH